MPVPSTMMAYGTPAIELAPNPAPNHTEAGPESVIRALPAHSFCGRVQVAPLLNVMLVQPAAIVAVIEKPRVMTRLVPLTSAMQPPPLHTVLPTTEYEPGLPPIAVNTTE